MARGWESKSVEEQIEEARANRPQQGPVLTKEEQEAARKRDSLLLQRTRVLRDLENCTSERYRVTLTAGLAYIDQQLASLPTVPPTSPTLPKTS